MQAHYEALYSMLMLISIELANEEVVVDLIRLVLAVQVGRWEAGCAAGAGWARMLLPQRLTQPCPLQT